MPIIMEVIKALEKSSLGADMSQIEDAMDGLMTAIRNSEEFIRYQAIKEKVHASKTGKPDHRIS